MQHDAAESMHKKVTDPRTSHATADESLDFSSAASVVKKRQFPGQVAAGART